MRATIRTVHVTTDASGDFTESVGVRGQLVAVWVDTGDLSTPDLDITDEPTGTSLLHSAAMAGDAIYYPQVASTDITDGTAGDGFVSPAVFGHLKVVIAGGGDTNTGTIKLMVI